jgi:hypothetical protein
MKETMAAGQITQFSALAATFQTPIIINKVKVATVKKTPKKMTTKVKTYKCGGKVKK